MDYKIFDLGLISFKKARDFERQVLGRIKAGIFLNALIFCRHYPVITLGRLAKKENVLASQKELDAKGIEVIKSSRGGDVTYHGPGQLTVYPLINLDFFKKDIHWFLRCLEEIVQKLLLAYGIKTERQSGFTGVWVNGKKIASIGISVKNWITFHGLSINILKEDLANFGLIRPCGMDIRMVSLEDLLNLKIESNELKDRLADIFKNEFREKECFKRGGFSMIKVILPELSEGIDKATVSYWYYQPGNKVNEKDELVELTTDKATFNLPSPASGTLSQILISEGQTAKVGDVLGIIEEN